MLVFSMRKKEQVSTYDFCGDAMGVKGGTWGMSDSNLS